MTVITQVINPVTDEPMLKAKGIIKRVNVSRVNPDGSPKTKQTTKGIMAWTHTLSLVLVQESDEVLVGFGTKEIKNLNYENFQIKVSDKYTTLEPGMEISLIVTSREYNGKTYYDGKPKDIKILSTGNVVPSPAQGNATTPSQPKSSPKAATGASVKVYGGVKAIDGITVTAVNQNDSKEYVFFVSDEQVKQLVVGGRIAGQIADGKLTSGFKAYAPVGSHPAKSTKKDDLPVRLGNGVSVAVALSKKGTLDIEVAKQIVVVIDQLREKLKAAHTDMDDYSIGARLGQAAIIAAGDPKVKTVEQVIVKAEEIFEVVTKAEADLRAPAQAADKADSSVAQEQKTVVDAPVGQSSTPDVPDVQYDFDDDIPF